MSCNLSAMPERFRKKVSIVGECWVWTGAKDIGGKGRILWNGRNACANRVAWELTRGVPEFHYHLFRSCKSASCVNPDHYEIRKRFINNSKCSVEQCQRKAVSLGLCSAHWQRVHKRKNLDPNRKVNDKFGHRNPKWKGGEVTYKDGRVGIYCPEHPYPNCSGIYVYRYRLVMEKHLGRYLLPEEIVHHINGDPTDDSVDNLQVMTQSEHARLHLSKNGRWSLSFDCCQGCGTTKGENNGFGLCSKCYNKRRKNAYCV